MREETVEKEELSTETSNTGVLTPDINKNLTSFELEEEEGTCKVTSLRTGNWTDWLKTFGKNFLIHCISSVQSLSLGGDEY